MGASVHAVASRLARTAWAWSLRSKTSSGLSTVAIVTTRPATNNATTKATAESASSLLRVLIVYPLACRDLGGNAHRSESECLSRLHCVSRFCLLGDILCAEGAAAPWVDFPKADGSTRPLRVNLSHGALPPGWRWLRSAILERVPEGRGSAGGQAPLYPSTARPPRRPPRGSRSGQTELLKHDRLIELLPAFAHLPTDRSIDDQPIDRHFSSGRRDGTEGPGVRPGGPPAECCRVTLDQVASTPERPWVPTGKSDTEIEGTPSAAALGA